SSPRSSSVSTAPRCRGFTDRQRTKGSEASPAMGTLHLAQVNIARMRGALEDPVMQGFVARLDEINVLADGSPGFVWRLQTDAGNATYLRPYDDERIIINMSVWKSIEDLRHFVYRGDHAEVLRQRAGWFEKLD